MIYSKTIVFITLSIPLSAIPNELICNSVIPENETTHEYRNTSDGGNLLAIIFPREPEAELNTLRVVYGANYEVAFDLVFELINQGYYAEIILPINHDQIVFEAIYHSEDCAILHHAKFINGNRVPWND